MIYSNFQHTIDAWLVALDDYSFKQLIHKPEADKWSVGQVYMHLIEATGYFLQQVEIAACNNDNMLQETSKSAQALFLNNEFPDSILEGPPSNALTPNPASRAEITDGLLKLKNTITELEKNYCNSSFKGKTKHFGLGYFNASEWLHFAEMHCRHHFRQKKRLDNLLQNPGFIHS